MGIEINKVNSTNAVNNTKETTTKNNEDKDININFKFTDNTKGNEQKLLDKVKDLLGEEGSYLTCTIKTNRKGEKILRLLRSPNDLQERFGADADEYSNCKNIDLNGIAQALGIKDEVMFKDRDMLLTITNRINPNAVGNGVIEPGTYLDFKLTDLGQRKPNLVERLFGYGRKYEQLKQLSEACK